MLPPHRWRGTRTARCNRHAAPGAFPADAAAGAHPVHAAHSQQQGCACCFGQPQMGECCWPRSWGSVDVVDGWPSPASPFQPVWHANDGTCGKHAYHTYHLIHIAYRYANMYPEFLTRIPRNAWGCEYWVIGVALVLPHTHRHCTLQRGMHRGQQHTKLMNPRTIPHQPRLRRSVQLVPHQASSSGRAEWLLAMQ